MLKTILLKDDLERLKMGRFRDSEEHELQRMMHGFSRDEGLVGRLAGMGIDVTRRGYRPTSPRMGRNGSTFSFSMTWAVRQVGGLADMAPGSKGAARGSARAEAKLGERPALEGGNKYYKTGFNSRPLSRESAGWFRRYIGRDGAASYTVGNVADEGAGFWERIHDEERAGGRVMGRIIAQLPHQLTEEGRKTAVRSFVNWFEENGLPFVAVIHRPERGNDPRNWHFHMLLHDRPIEGRTASGRLRLAPRKLRICSERGFAAQLRSKFADCVNVVLDREKVDLRYDPRSYREAGVDKLPAPHLGPAVAALERRGVATDKGGRAAGAEAVSRLISLNALLHRRLSDDLGVVEKARARVHSAVTAESALKDSACRILSAAALYARMSRQLQVAETEKFLCRDFRRSAAVRLQLASGSPVNSKMVRRASKRAAEGADEIAVDLENRSKQAWRSALLGKNDASARLQAELRRHDALEKVVSLHRAERRLDALSALAGPSKAGLSEDKAVAKASESLAWARRQLEDSLLLQKKVVPGPSQVDLEAEIRRRELAVAQAQGNLRKAERLAKARLEQSDPTLMSRRSQAEHEIEVALRAVRADPLASRMARFVLDRSPGREI